MEYWLGTSPWYGVTLWIILYISDYYLTIYSARGFREIGHFQFEVFELTPQYQKEVEALKPVSKLHVLLLVLYTLLLLFIWWLINTFLFFPWTYLAYSFYLGMFLLLEVAVHFRHLRNIFLIHEVKKNGGVEGQISYRKEFSYRVSAFEFDMFSVLFLIIAAFYYSPFFLGGAIMCLATGIKHSRLAQKAKSTPLQASQP
ncbi:MAG TPA: hypothetical protein VFQ13_22840 [Anaerolineales bacterium]|nr:hypothetical protein [Anaerolineales bacterium]